MKQSEKKVLIFAAMLLLLAFPASAGGSMETETESSSNSAGRYVEPFPKSLLLNLEPYRRAVFAGGCFWCLEWPFERLAGVAEVLSGFTGGDEVNPSYEDVVYGRTGHLEAVEVYYNPLVISFSDLLEVFWRNIDPTDSGGQFADRGDHYRTAVFYKNESEKLAAERSAKKLAESGRYNKPLVTEILPLKEFYHSEEYHQDYYLKNPSHYKAYFQGSGRGPYIQRMWSPLESPEGFTTKEGLWANFDKKARLAELTELQYKVTQLDGTEPPFRNKYWNTSGEGIYVDIVSGEPLFSSTDKYDSGTGWPSYIRPIHPDYVVYREDYKLFSRRIEVRSRYADSHLGHVFEDGPELTGLRFCINSAALRFVSAEKMAEEGYGQYLVYFTDKN